MTASVGLNGMEITGSNNLGTSVYKVTFDLTNTEGPMGYATADKMGQPRSYALGSLSVEIPLNQTDEGQVLARAREVLHAALIQLAEAARPPK